VPWAFNTLHLWLAVYVLGVLVNAISVGVNSQAAQMELSSGQRNMGKLHAESSALQVLDAQDQAIEVTTEFVRNVMQGKGA
jgi:hypothetical protein